ncbi:MAG: hypothetical protein NZ932_03805 [Candidatus Bathyarchaeota archaeon]|nr:hypothetical protein [Candidatus Bathyarchaeota archaeon]MDW8022407.1 hypothetical protein [Nitrososphaerota archaeon]
MSQKKWRKVGYISLSRNQTCVVIKIEGKRYIAEISDVLEVLTKKQGYANVFGTDSVQ